MDKALQYIEKNRENFVEELKKLLQFPSVSADSKYKEDVARCADYVQKRFESLGLEARQYPTKGHPIVFAEYKRPENKRTLLVYGHYDVQPVDPLNLWNKPPFEPHIENGHIYARGATDDKGQFLIHLLATESYLKTDTPLPVNLKFVIEGEEEIASNNLDDFIHEQRDLLTADGAIISDGSMYAPEVPAITYGLRGIAAAEIKLIGPNRDLHSGSFGGSICNPVTELARLIARFHGDDYHVQIDGFYDDVRALESWEREAFANLPHSEEEYLATTGSAGLAGEAGYTTLERIWARPTCEINGIYGGYSGEGSKTIIPSWAGAKVTMRLVPDQNPDDILDKFESYVKKVAPKGVKVEVNKLGGAKPAIVSRDSFLVKAAIRALQKAYGSEPVFMREGGSIPIVNVFKEELGVDTLLLGFGQQDDNAHSPNEKFSLSDFHRGIITAVHLFSETQE